MDNTSEPVIFDLEAAVNYARWISDWTKTLSSILVVNIEHHWTNSTYKNIQKHNSTNEIFHQRKKTKIQKGRNVMNTDLNMENDSSYGT